MTSESHVSLTLPNLKVLDCEFCNQPLTIPVFHCKNGHTACKTCRQRPDSECDTCGLLINSKCSHLEEIIRSFKPCKNKVYGCADLIGYGDSGDHAMNCVYWYFPCPESGCRFRGVSSQLTGHYFATHTRLSGHNSIVYNCKFDLKLMKSQDIYVLKEWFSKDVFVVRNETATSHGNNSISISFVSPTPGFSTKVVEVKVVAPLRSLQFCGRIPNARSISDEHQPPPLLVIPSEVFGFSESFSINLKLLDGDEVDADKRLEKEKRRVEYILETVRPHVSKHIWDAIDGPFYG